MTYLWNAESDASLAFHNVIEVIWLQSGGKINDVSAAYRNIT